MPKYMFAYHGGSKPATDEEGQKAMQAWGNWFEKIGAHIVDAGNPVGQSFTVSNNGVVDNGGANPLSGYGIFNADDMQSACEMAAGCPMVQDGSGNVEVAEIIEM